MKANILSSAIIVLLMNSPVQAFVSASDEHVEKKRQWHTKNCQDRGDFAGSVMEKRQNGVAKEKLLKGVDYGQSQEKLDKLQKIINDAYAESRLSSKKEKKTKINEFNKQWKEACYQYYGIK